MPLNQEVCLVAYRVHREQIGLGDRLEALECGFVDSFDEVHVTVSIP